MQLLMCDNSSSTHIQDEFVDSVSRDKDQKIRAKIEEQRSVQRSFGSPLDPILASLVRRIALLNFLHLVCSTLALRAGKRFVAFF